MVIFDTYNVPLMSQAELLQDPARSCEILRDPATSCGSRQLVGGVVGVTATVELYEVLRRPNNLNLINHHNCTYTHYIPCIC
jgi:hypothetical protein